MFYQNEKKQNKFVLYEFQATYPMTRRKMKCNDKESNLFLPQQQNLWIITVLNTVDTNLEIIQKTNV